MDAHPISIVAKTGSNGGAVSEIACLRDLAIALLNHRVVELSFVKKTLWSTVSFQPLSNSTTLNCYFSRSHTANPSRSGMTVVKSFREL